MMNETKFNFSYFFETLVGRLLYIAMNLPTIYTTLITMFVILLLGIENDIIGYLALAVGLILKLVFTISSKHKVLQKEWITIGIDLIGGVLIVLLSGFVIEIIVIALTILYLMYYSYIVTISYTRLGHTAEDLLNDLKHRHEHQNKNTKKRK
jgi:hypothetical protein